MHRRRFFNLMFGGALLASGGVLSGCVVADGRYGSGPYRAPFADYYYYPSTNVYFHRPTGYYYYRDRTDWRRVRSLPRHVRLDERERRELRGGDRPPFERRPDQHRPLGRRDADRDRERSRFERREDRFDGEARERGLDRRADDRREDRRRPQSAAGDDRRRGDGAARERARPDQRREARPDREGGRPSRDARREAERAGRGEPSPDGVMNAPLPEPVRRSSSDE